MCFIYNLKGYFLAKGAKSAKKRKEIINIYYCYNIAYFRLRVCYVFLYNSALYVIAERILSFNIIK